MASARDRKIAQFQPKGEVKTGRKVSRPTVTKPDEVSSAHVNEDFRKKAKRTDQNNKGGRN